MFGITFAYQLHTLANIICAWLVVVHFSAIGASPDALRGLLVEHGRPPPPPPPAVVAESGLRAKGEKRP